MPLFPDVGLNYFFDQLLVVMFLIGFAVYVIFAFIALRQIQVMRNTVTTPLSGMISVLGYLHLALALGAFFFAFFSLT